MYENESAAVRVGIEFLQAMTEKEYLLDPTFDVLDLEEKLNEIQADINRLISNLPVEAINDGAQREEYPGDFADSEELEDEVVECEKLITQATELLAVVRLHYLPSPSIQPETTPVPSKPIQTNKKKNINWSFLWIIIILGILIVGAILF